MSPEDLQPRLINQPTSGTLPPIEMRESKEQFLWRTEPFKMDVKPLYSTTTGHVKCGPGPASRNCSHGNQMSRGARGGTQTVSSPRPSPTCMLSTLRAVLLGLDVGTTMETAENNVPHAESIAMFVVSAITRRVLLWRRAPSPLASTKGKTALVPAFQHCHDWLPNMEVSSPSKGGRARTSNCRCEM